MHSFQRLLLVSLCSFAFDINSHRVNALHSHTYSQSGDDCVNGVLGKGDVYLLDKLNRYVKYKHEGSTCAFLYERQSSICGYIPPELKAVYVCDLGYDIYGEDIAVPATKPISSTNTAPVDNQSLNFSNSITTINDFASISGVSLQFHSNTSLTELINKPIVFVVECETGSITG